jgi:poly-gamma-glutamate capsule biosynthesis protein CapA/YwtB (metallophosphatase superfamily)
MTGGRVTLALAGDTMLGRGVAATLHASPPARLFAPELVELLGEADLVVLNLECCISERGEPWPDPRKPFFFRGPPAAADALAGLGVDAVTLANNHALDFGTDALLDTLAHLRRVGIAAVGAGADAAAARRPAVLEAAGVRLALVGLTDHPVAYAAAEGRPGVAYAELDGGPPAWVEEAIRGAGADAVVVTPHWGPNMNPRPLPHVRRAAAALREAGATLVAGHSAHVFQGVEDAVLYDLGDFLDDYRVDPVLRNDLGLVFLVTLDAARPTRLEAVPIALNYCHTRLAGGADARWIAQRFRAACAELGTDVVEEAGRLVVEWPAARRPSPQRVRRAR